MTPPSETTDDAPARVLAVIDSRVNDPDGLASALGPSVDVLMIDADTAGIDAVAAHPPVSGMLSKALRLP